MSHKPN